MKTNYVNLRFIIVRGNLSDGYAFVGPFESFDEAADADVQLFGGDSWIATLVHPADVSPASRKKMKP